MCNSGVFDVSDMLLWLEASALHLQFRLELQFELVVSLLDELCYHVIEIDRILILHMLLYLT